MRLSKLLVLLFLTLASQVHAHSDFIIVKNYGNVKVRIVTGFEYEEINKSWIIGQLAYELCQRLVYKDTVLLDFKHHYVEHCTPDYFIGFNDGSIKENNSDDIPEAFLKENAIVVREVSRSFDPCTSLNLIEFAIKNLDLVKKQQKAIVYNKNYNNWIVKSIDTVIIRKSVLIPVSKAVETTLNTKIYRPKTEGSKNNEEFSYFFQSGKYHIYYKDRLSDIDKAKDSVLLVVNNIYQFELVTYDEAVIFDSDSTFYFVKGINNPRSSSKYYIQNNFGYFEPYDIKKIGWNKIAINFCCSGSYKEGDGKDVTLLLLTKQGKVIQDIDNLIDKSLNNSR